MLTCDSTGDQSALLGCMTLYKQNSWYDFEARFLMILYHSNLMSLRIPFWRDSLRSHEKLCMRRRKRKSGQNANVQALSKEPFIWPLMFSWIKMLIFFVWNNSRMKTLIWWSWFYMMCVREIYHAWAAEMKWNEKKNDPRICERNLCNCTNKRKKKKSEFQRGSKRVTPRWRCDWARKSLN